MVEEKKEFSMEEEIVKMININKNLSFKVPEEIVKVPEEIVKMININKKLIVKMININKKLLKNSKED